MRTNSIDSMIPFIHFNLKLPSYSIRTKNMTMSVLRYALPSLAARGLGSTSCVVTRSAALTPLTRSTPSLVSKAFLTFHAHDSVYLIINSLGVDRTGIVSELSKLVTDSGGNVGESQAAKVGTHFSLTMLVSVPKDKSTHLQESLQSLSGMTTHCIETETDPAAVQVKPSIAYKGRFVLEGADDPGLVHKVTSILAKHNLSIDTMKTSDEIAPHGGTTLFKIDGIATALSPLPKSFDAEAIGDELSELGNNLNCDISLEEETA